MGQHADLSTMVGIMRDHVSEHCSARWPRPAPTVAMEEFDRPAWRERLPQHFRAIPSAARERDLHLASRAAPSVKLYRQLDMGSRKPQPLSASLMHVRKDRRDGADVAAGWLCHPSPWI